MKKLMFISLLVIPFCKAAQGGHTWNEVVKSIPDYRVAKSLNLDNKGIIAIPELINYPFLEALFLSNNQLETLHDLIFFYKLKRLYLDHNKLSEIPGTLRLDKLEELYLSNNKFKYIDPNIFKQFPRLKLLDVRNNPLSPENIIQLQEAAKAAGAKLLINMSSKI